MFKHRSMISTDINYCFISLYCLSEETIRLFVQQHVYFNTMNQSPILLAFLQREQTYQYRVLSIHKKASFAEIFPCHGIHDNVIKWRHFPRYWPFVRGIHRSPVNSQHKGQWRGALMFSLICVWINGWVNNRVAGDLRWHRAHYNVIVMCIVCRQSSSCVLMRATIHW